LRIVEVAQTNGRLELSRDRAAHAIGLAVRLGFLLLWYLFFGRIFLPFIAPFLLAWPWPDLFQQFMAELGALIAQGGGELSPAAQATLFPIGIWLVTLAWLLAPLLTLPELCSRARIALAGEVFTLDRDTRQFRRNGKLVAALEDVASVRVRHSAHEANEGRDRYRLAIVLTSGRAITLQESWDDEPRVRRLAEQIARHIGAALEFESTAGPHGQWWTPRARAPHGAPASAPIGVVERRAVPGPADLAHGSSAVQRGDTAALLPYRLELRDRGGRYATDFELLADGQPVGTAAVTATAYVEDANGRLLATASEWGRSDRGRHCDYRLEVSDGGGQPIGSIIQPGGVWEPPGRDQGPFPHVPHYPAADAGPPTTPDATWYWNGPAARAEPVEAPVDRRGRAGDFEPRSRRRFLRGLEAGGHSGVLAARQPHAVSDSPATPRARPQAWARHAIEAGYALYRSFDTVYLILDAHRRDVATLRKPRVWGRYLVLRHDEVVGWLDHQGDDWRLQLEEGGPVDPRLLVVLAALTTWREKYRRGATGSLD
jgi:hypothetical protein